MADDIDIVEQTYVDFKEKNKSFWTCFLIGIIFLSIALALATLWVINQESTVDCEGLLPMQYAMIAFHMVNLVVALIALTGFELKVCTNNACCIYVLYVFVNIVGLNVVYFNAQRGKCFTNGSMVYNISFTQIIIIYILTVYVVCHLFRKNCQEIEEEDVPEHI